MPVRGAHTGTTPRPTPAESLRRILDGEVFIPKLHPGDYCRHGPRPVSRLAAAADPLPATGLPPLPALAALVDGPDWGRVADLPEFRAALAEVLAGDGRHPLTCARRVASVALSGLLGPPAQARDALRPAWERVGEGLQAAMLLAPAALQKTFCTECARLTVLDPRLQLHHARKEGLNGLAWGMGLPAGRHRSREELLVTLFDEDAARRAVPVPRRPLPPQLLLAHAMLSRWRVTAAEGNVKQGLQMSILRRLPSTTFAGAPKRGKRCPPGATGATLYRLRDVLAARGTHWTLPRARACEEDVRTRGRTRVAMQGVVLCPGGVPRGDGPQGAEVSQAVEAARPQAEAEARQRSEEEAAGLTRQQRARMRRQQRKLEAAFALAREEAAAALRFGDGPHLRATLQRLEERRREVLGGGESAGGVDCPFCQHAGMERSEGGVRVRHLTDVDTVLGHIMEAPCWAAVQCFPV